VRTGFQWENLKEEDRPYGRPRRSWKNNIKMGLREVGWAEDMDWIYLAQDRDRWWALVNAVMYPRVR
jgi:hypothetical protein